MVGDGGTPMNNAVMPEQLAKGVANVFPLTSTRSMYEPLNHLKFGLGSSYYDQVRAGLKYFIEQKGKKQVCSMAQDTDFGRDVTEGVNDQLKAENLTLAGGTRLEAIKDYHDIFGSPVISFSATKHQGPNQSFLCVVKDGHWQVVEAEPLGY